jgi:hypothetical protein
VMSDENAATSHLLSLITRQVVYDLVTCYSSLITHHSSLITHHSSLVTCFLLLE